LIDESDESESVESESDDSDDSDDHGCRYQKRQLKHYTALHYTMDVLATSTPTPHQTLQLDV